MNGLENPLILSSLLLGARHGFDVDHIAAIADISATQLQRRKALMLSLLYAVGHATAVYGLGLAVLVMGGMLSTALDDYMGKVIGVTLIILSMVVLINVFRSKGKLAPRSKYLMLTDALGLTREGSKLTGALSCFTIGVIHGVGIESPTQIVALAAAGGVGEFSGTSVVLLAFVLGMLVSNMVLAISATMGFKITQNSQWAFSCLSLLAAGFSLYVGIECLFA